MRREYLREGRIHEGMGGHNVKTFEHKVVAKDAGPTHYIDRKEGETLPTFYDRSGGPYLDYRHSVELFERIEKLS